MQNPRSETIPAIHQFRLNPLDEGADLVKPGPIKSFNPRHHNFSTFIRSNDAPPEVQYFVTQFNESIRPISRRAELTLIINFKLAITTQRQAGTDATPFTFEPEDPRLVLIQHYTQHATQATPAPWNQGLWERIGAILMCILPEDHAEFPDPSYLDLHAAETGLSCEQLKKWRIYIQEKMVKTSRERGWFRPQFRQEHAGLLLTYFSFAWPALIQSCQDEKTYRQAMYALLRGDSIPDSAKDLNDLLSIPSLLTLPQYHNGESLIYGSRRPSRPFEEQDFSCEQIRIIVYSLIAASCELFSSTAIPPLPFPLPLMSILHNFKQPLSTPTQDLDAGVAYKIRAAIRKLNPVDQPMIDWIGAILRPEREFPNPISRLNPLELLRLVQVIQYMIAKTTNPTSQIPDLTQDQNLRYEAITQTLIIIEQEDDDDDDDIQEFNVRILDCLPGALQRIREALDGMLRSPRDLGFLLNQIKRSECQNFGNSHESRERFLLPNTQTIQHFNDIFQALKDLSLLSILLGNSIIRTRLLEVMIRDFRGLRGPDSTLKVLLLNLAHDQVQTLLTHPSMTTILNDAFQSLSLSIECLWETIEFVSTHHPELPLEKTSLFTTIPTSLPCSLHVLTLLRTHVNSQGVFLQSPALQSWLMHHIQQKKIDADDWTALLGMSLRHLQSTPFREKIIMMIHAHIPHSIVAQAQLMRLSHAINDRPESVALLSKEEVHALQKLIRQISETASHFESLRSFLETIGYHNLTLESCETIGTAFLEQIENTLQCLVENPLKGKADYYPTLKPIDPSDYHRENFVSDRFHNDDRAIIPYIKKLLLLNPSHPQSQTLLTALKLKTLSPRICFLALCSCFTPYDTLLSQYHDDAAHLMLFNTLTPLLHTVRAIKFRKYFLEELARIPLSSPSFPGFLPCHIQAFLDQRFSAQHWGSLMKNIHPERLSLLFKHHAITTALRSALRNLTNLAALMEHAGNNARALWEIDFFMRCTVELLHTTWTEGPDTFLSLIAILPTSHIPLYFEMEPFQRVVREQLKTPGPPYNIKDIVWPKTPWDVPKRVALLSTRLIQTAFLEDLFHEKLCGSDIFRFISSEAELTLLFTSGVIRHALYRFKIYNPKETQQELDFPVFYYDHMMDDFQLRKFGDPILRALSNLKLELLEREKGLDQLTQDLNLAFPAIKLDSKELFEPLQKWISLPEIHFLLRNRFMIQIAGNIQEKLHGSSANASGFLTQLFSDLSVQGLSTKTLDILKNLEAQLSEMACNMKVSVASQGKRI